MNASSGSYRTLISLVILFAAMFRPSIGQQTRTVLPGHVPAIISQLAPTGRVAATNHLYLAIGLPLRNLAQMDELLQQLYHPNSTNFHKFLTPSQFTERFGPTEEDYQALIDFAQANGLTVAGIHSNRAVLDVSGTAQNVEQAFNVTLQTYQHPTEQRTFFAPSNEPSVPANLRVADMWGMSDFALPRPLSKKANPKKLSALNYNGSGPSGSYQGSDFRNAYAAGVSLTGTGQIAAVAEFDGYYASDITAYEDQCGYAHVALQNVLVNGVSGTPGYSGIANAVVEVSLDIELIIAMAPGLSSLIVYEGVNPYDVFNRIVSDNAAKQISCSWAWGTGPSHNWGHPGTRTLDSRLQQMAAQGQSFFQASGDSDAYTGSQALSSSGGPIPVDSIYVTTVGGTSLTMNGVGTSWSSETVWNWGNNTGSGGGISPNYAIPSWQANVSMTANSGSTVNRNIPDVAMTADAVEVVYNNGSSGIFGGTSCAAPLWAGFCALVNQQSISASGTTVGFLNPALYAIAGTSNYNTCFRDVTTGNNIGNNTPGLFFAVTNYDLATGLGTPNGINLINALAPQASPYIVTQPTSQTVTNGANVVLSVSVGGQAPLSYRWRVNGTNLPAAGNISGTTSNILSFTPALTNNSGNYTLVVTNTAGSVTSTVAVLSVGLPPTFSIQPTNLTVLSGGNAVFAAAVTGSLPLVYQWRKNGTNLANGASVSGATSNVLTLTSVTTNSGGNFSLVATNGFGSKTSSVAALTVVLPPSFVGSLTNRTIECGSNITYAATASGTPPLSFQWSVDGSPISGATNTSLSLSNVHLPNHTVALRVTNLYGTALSNALLTVQDTIPPLVTLIGSNLVYVDVGAVFADPGAIANDICAGPLTVSTNGLVNTSSAGTNTLTYMAFDGNGNTNTLTRTVIVQDTAPAIVSAASNPDGTFSLGMIGGPGRTYVLESTTNVFSGISWQSLATNTLGTNTSWQFSDGQATNFQQRFYRLRFVP
jgi:subtilase family serine protease